MSLALWVSDIHWYEVQGLQVWGAAQNSAGLSSDSSSL